MKNNVGINIDDIPESYFESKTPEKEPINQLPNGIGINKVRKITIHGILKNDSSQNK